MKLRPISLSWLTLVLAIALLLIIVGAATYWSYTDSVRRYERQSNSLFEQAESIIELTLQQHAQALGQSLETIVDKMHTALPTDNRRDSAHLTQLLTEQYALHSAYSLDVLAYADQLSSTPLIDVSLEHFTFGQLLQTFEEQPFRFAQPTILSFRTEPSSEPLTLMLLEKAVVDPVSGRSMGTLYGGIVLSHHGRILAEIGQKAQLARVELIDETGQLLASSQRGTPENTALRLCPDTTQNAPSSHITRCYPLIGSASIRILLESPPDLFASLRQDVHHRLTWIVLLSALLIVAGAAIYQQLISRALRTFIRYTRRLAVRREHTPFVPTMIAEFNLAGEALERMHSEQKAYEDRIRYQATHDPLTGLPNRTRFMEQLRSALKNTQSKKLAVLFIDLDRFKVINDTLGHHIGDEVLIGVSKRFRRVPILCDTVSRFGGDEFVAYIENIDTQENGGHIAQAILDTFQAPFHAGGQDLFLRCSIGLSLYPDDARNAEGLLRHADSAMYRAKAFGRNNYQFYTAAMSFQAQERLSLESDLHRALDNHEFLLYYQPKIELESGAITGMEALLRWKHPQHGIMSPDNFIPILEEVGLIVPVGEWVLWEAAKACAKWQQQAGRPLQVAVNLSYRQLQGNPPRK